jgi:hypothetical protein
MWRLSQRTILINAQRLALYTAFYTFDTVLLAGLLQCSQTLRNAGAQDDSLLIEAFANDWGKQTYYQGRNTKIALRDQPASGISFSALT